MSCQDCICVNFFADPLFIFEDVLNSNSFIFESFFFRIIYHSFHNDLIFFKPTFLHACSKLFVQTLLSYYEMKTQWNYFHQKKIHFYQVISYLIEDKAYWVLTSAVLIHIFSFFVLHFCWEHFYFRHLTFVLENWLYFGEYSNNQLRNSTQIKFDLLFDGNYSKNYFL